MKKCLCWVLSSFVFSVAVAADDDTLVCENAISTFQINQCAAIELDAAKAELAKYLETSFEHNSYDPKLIQSIRVAQADWQVYMSAVLAAF